jgi:hypothetical protein
MKWAKKNKMNPAECQWPWRLFAPTDDEMGTHFEGSMNSHPQFTSNFFFSFLVKTILLLRLFGHWLNSSHTIINVSSL